MKVLVVSILRLGDIVLSSSALEGIKTRFPNAEIDLVINDQFTFVGDILSGVHQIIPFPRSIMQKEMNDSKAPLLQPYDELKLLVTDLNHRRYDMVINLTQNRLSGYVCSLVESKETLGLHFSQRGEPIYGDGWFRYLNDSKENPTDFSFHFGDALRMGSGEESYRPIRLVRKYKDVQRALKLKSEFSKDKIVAIQLQSSDRKKDIPRSALLSTCVNLSQLHHDIHFLVLGAPSESRQVEDFVDALRGSQVSAISEIGTLGEVLSVLDICDGLITPDTAIKHIASATTCPVLEVCLGSSRPEETGSYKTGTVVVQPLSQCYPCNHSSECVEQYVCQESLTADLLSMIMSRLISNQISDIHKISEEFSDIAKVSMTYISNSGFFMLLPFGAKVSLDDLFRQLFGKLAFSTFLSSNRNDLIGDYGTRALRLISDWQFILKFRGEKDNIDEIVSQSLSRGRIVEKDIEALLFKMSRLSKGPSKREKEDLIALWKQMMEQGYGAFVNRNQNIEKELLETNGMSFQGIRSIQNDIQKISEVSQIESRLLRAVKSNCVEM